METPNSNSSSFSIIKLKPEVKIAAKDRTFMDLYNGRAPVGIIADRCEELGLPLMSEHFRTTKFHLDADYRIESELDEYTHCIVFQILQEMIGE